MNYVDVKATQGLSGFESSERIFKEKGDVESLFVSTLKCVVETILPEVWNGKATCVNCLESLDDVRNKVLEERRVRYIWKKTLESLIAWD